MNSIKMELDKLIEEIAEAHYNDGHPASSVITKYRRKRKSQLITILKSKLRNNEKVYQCMSCEEMIPKGEQLIFCGECGR